MFRSCMWVLIVSLPVAEPRTQVSSGVEPLTIVRGSCPSSDQKAPADLWGEALPLGAVTRMHASSFRDVRQIVAAALSADGTVAALATNQNQLHLFDARTTKLLKRLNVESFGTPFLAFTPDGGKLAWINQGGALILWDVAQEKEVGG